MKLRRCIALILALAFVFAFMAMSVSAAVTRAACPECGNLDTYYYPTTYTYYQRVENCKNHSTVHNHTVTEYYNKHVCRACNYSFSGSADRVVRTCPYGSL